MRPRSSEARLCIALTVAAVLLHAIVAFRLDGLWRDEIATFHFATLPLSDAASLLRFDGYPPLHSFLLRIWTLSGTITELWWLRAFGFFTGLLTLAGLWALARGRNGYPLIGLLVVGLHPVLVRWGDTLRPAGLSVAVLIAMLLAFQALVRKVTRRHLAIAALVAVIAVNTAYTNALVVFALCVATAVLAIRRSETVQAGAILGVGGIAAISMLPWIGLMRAQQEWIFSDTVAWIDAPNVEIVSELSRTFGPLVLMGPVLMCALVLVNTRRSGRPTGEPDALRDGQSYLALGSALACGLLLIFLFTLRFTPSIWYYFPVVAIAGAALDGFMQGDARARSRHIIAGIAALSLVFVPGWSMLLESQTNVDEAANVVAREAGADDLIIVEPLTFGISFDFYYRGETAWATIPPVTDHRVHRYDLARAAVAEGRAGEIRQRAIRTIEEGHRVWRVGHDPSTFAAMTRTDEPPQTCEREVALTRKAQVAERVSVVAWSAGACDDTAQGLPGNE